MLAGLSLRRGVFWTLAGTAIYSLCQWLLVVVLARMATPEIVGQFALILAICAPIYLMIGLNLRIVVATDVRRRWNMSEYLRTRRVLALLSLLTSLAVGLLLGLRGVAFASLTIVAAAKAGEAYAQTLYGYYQVNRRLDIAAQSMMLRGFVGTTAFALIYGVSHNLMLACGGLLIGWQLTLWLWDIPHAKRLSLGDPGGVVETPAPVPWSTVGAISRKALPLGIDTGLRSLALNTPRFAIAIILGRSSLGVYTALAALAVLPVLVTSSIGSSAMPSLAQSYIDGRRSSFIRLYSRILGASFAVSTVFIVATYFAGQYLVQVLLGTQYNFRSLLMVLVVAHSVEVFQGVVCQGLQAANRFVSIAIADATALGLVAVLSLVLVPRYGTIGAALSLGLAMAASSLMLGVAVWMMMRRMPITA